MDFGNRIVGEGWPAPKEAAMAAAAKIDTIGAPAVPQSPEDVLPEIRDPVLRQIEEGQPVQPVEAAALHHGDVVPLCERQSNYDLPESTRVLVLRTQVQVREQGVVGEDVAHGGDPVARQRRLRDHGRQVVGDGCKEETSMVAGAYRVTTAESNL